LVSYGEAKGRWSRESSDAVEESDAVSSFTALTSMFVTCYTAAQASEITLDIDACVYQISDRHTDTLYEIQYTVHSS
jgi:hypothetical protein